MGTGNVSDIELCSLCFNGPKLTGPVAVATKKLATEPTVNPLPLMVKESPTKIGWEIAVMLGVVALNPGPGRVNINTTAMSMKEDSKETAKLNPVCPDWGNFEKSTTFHGKLSPFANEKSRLMLL
jgi:hypothetical protein